MDDTGVTHIPSGNVRLLSPQHWARAINGSNRTKSKSAGETTTADSTTLFWSNGRYRLTIPMCPKTNVATFKSAPGYKEYQAFCEQAEFDNTEDIHPIIAEPGVNTGGSDEESKNGTMRLELETTDATWPSPNKRNISEDRLAGRDQVEEKESEIEAKRDSITSEFLSLHYRSGHMSFQKLQVMARQGVIPRKFATSPIPICAACMYGKATKRRWRDKPAKKPKETQEKQPGDKVSVDQMVSPTPGLVTQMTRILS